MNTPFIFSFIVSMLKSETNQKSLKIVGLVIHKINVTPYYI